MRSLTILLLYGLATTAACQTMDSEFPTKLDEPEYHIEFVDMESFETTRVFEFEDAAGHIVLFYVWAVERGLVPEEWPHTLGNADMVMKDGRTAQEWTDEEYRAMLASVRGRAPDAMDRALNEVAEGLFSSSFTDEAAPFAVSCYDTWLGNFHTYLGTPEDELVEATWERLDKVAPHLDTLYEQHLAGGCV